MLEEIEEHKGHLKKIEKKSSKKLSFFLISRDHIDPKNVNMSELVLEDFENNRKVE